jgi:hypothetical protein
MRSDANALTQKGNAVLYLDKELVEKSKELGFNLLKTFENHLKQLMMQSQPSNLINNVDLESNKNTWCGRRDLNPGSLAWKASILLMVIGSLMS